MSEKNCHSASSELLENIESVYRHICFLTLNVITGKLQLGPYILWA